MPSASFSSALETSALMRPKHVLKRHHLERAAQTWTQQRGRTEAHLRAGSDNVVNSPAGAFERLHRSRLQVRHQFKAATSWTVPMTTVTTVREGEPKNS